MLYGAHHRALAQMATLLVNDLVIAEEIVEAAFAAMHAVWWRLRDSDKALSYLQRAVVRRARSRRAAHPGSSRQRRGSPQTGQPDPTAPEALLIAALQALPPRQYEALILRFHVGLPDTQISFVMGVSTRSASQHVERGVADLQAVLERHHTTAADRPAGDAVTARTPPTSG